VLAALTGGRPDRTPFVIWDNKIPDPVTLSALLEREACVTVKSAAYTTILEGIITERESFTGADGAPRVRVRYRTPAGPVTVIQRPMPGTVWTEQHLFTSPGDYDALECLVAARRHTPCPERFERDDARHAGQSFARPATLHSPIHEVVNDLLGVEAFCVEWFENRDRVERLIAVVRADLLRQVQLFAASPARYCVVDGNTQFDILGLERYERYSLPWIAEACDILHAAGKLAGAHLDGNNGVAAHLVARTTLDFIESFTPAPGSDLTLAAARQAWPGKALVVNFPSAVHHGGATAVRDQARALLREAGDGRGVLMGVLEDVPTAEHLAVLAEETRNWKPENHGAEPVVLRRRAVLRRGGAAKGC
jgi:hypothetical protein